MSVKRSCFSLNVRGIRDLSKRKALFLFCMSQKREIYFFQETHSSFKDETFCRNQWGGNILFCHGTNHSAGVLILFDRNFSGSILQSFSSSEGRWIIVVILLGVPFRAVTRHHGEFSVMGIPSLQPFLKSYWLTPVQMTGQLSQSMQI